jgi:hypothetical protein
MTRYYTITIRVLCTALPVDHNHYLFALAIRTALPLCFQLNVDDKQQSLPHCFRAVMCHGREQHQSFARAQSPVSKGQKHGLNN